MTMQEIQRWLYARIELPQTRKYTDTPTSSTTRVAFSNGDVFEQHTTDTAYNTMHSRYTINGEIIRETDWTWNPDTFGWKELQTA